MKIVPAKCPNCGANINVDEEQETTKCEYCGDAILIDRAIQKYQIEIKVSNIPDLDNYLTLGERSYQDEDYNNAFEYYNKAITLDPNNYLVILRLGLTKGLISNYDNLSLQQINNTIDNSMKLANQDVEKYKIIVKESLNCIKTIESKLENYYENANLSKNEAISLNEKCTNVLTILSNLLKIEDLIENDNNQKLDLLGNINSFIEFVIKPKVYNTRYVKKNGKREKYSLKLKRNKLKEVYDFWNTSIDKYNNISNEKISNKKLPLIQLDFHTLKLIGSIILVIILIVILIKILFFNNESFGEYSGPYDCSNFEIINLNEISSSKYNKKKLKTYLNKKYNFSGKISNINLEGDHPYFEVDHKGVKLYINNKEKIKVELRKIGDEISFCGIVKESKFDIVKIENVTIVENNKEKEL